MTRRAALLLGAAAFGAAVPASAETVRVRAGEHAAYTRLVIDAPRGADFAWGVEGARLTATLGAPVTGLDVAPARAGRGLSRVAGVGAEGTTLSVDMTCDCGARTSTLADGRIVIDIAQNAPRPPAPTAQRAPDAAPAEAAAETAAAAAQPAPAPMAPVQGPAPRPAAKPDPAPTAEAASPEIAAAPGEAPAEAPAPPEAAADPDVETARRIEAARQALLRQLTAAAEQGLVELADRDDPDAPRDGAATEVVGDAPSDQVRARDAIEIARDRDPRLPPIEPELPAHCIPATAFALKDWRDDRPFEAQIGAARRRLIGEFDDPAPEVAVRYARLLISFGLGVEARSAMETFLTPSDSTRLLTDLASVIDGDAPAADGPLRQGGDCPMPHGAWAAAAQALAGELDVAAVDPDALAGAMRQMPAPARMAVATPVGAAAMDAGAVKLAEIVVEVAESARGPKAHRETLLDVLAARLAASRGAHARAEDALARIGKRATPAGVEAMIRLSEMRIARGLKPPRGLAANMEAVAFTLGDTPMARRLLVAAATARAHGEGLDLALQALQALSARAGGPGVATEAARLMLASFEPDAVEIADYIETVLAHWSLVGDGPEGDAARIAVAQRLAEAGVDNLSARLLAPAVARGVPEARLAAARAAFAAGDMEQALSLLADMDRPDAAAIRAQTYARLGRWREAAAAARAAGDRDGAATFSLRAGDYAAAAEAGAPESRLLAAMMTDADVLPADLRETAAGDPALEKLVEAVLPAQTGPNGGEGTVLEAAQAALEAARRRREIMGELLTDG